jgi:succinoglycan biosynthesis protein ExoV
MRLYVYRDRAPNFGDELNPWLFPRLLPGFFDDAPEVLFLGIGSILFDSHPAGARKLVFGSGYGGYTAPPVMDSSWDVRFVRGHRTAAQFGLPAATAVGDSAILLATLGLRRAPLAGKRIFMPHIDSACDGAWAPAAAEAGLHYVDPRGSVDAILAEILSAEMVVTEAMHGAIVADALRVPWVGMRPLHGVHHNKWLDWASVLDLRPRLQNLPPSNALEVALRAASGRREVQRRLRWYFRAHTAFGAGLARAAAVRALRAAAAATPQLSADPALDRAASRMQQALHRLTSG